MQRYNVAFQPEDPVFADACIAASRRQFADSAEGYLLSREDALPHVTLCQFDAKASQIKGIWQDMERLQPQRLQLIADTDYARRGDGEHANYMWVGLNIVRNQEIAGLQQLVYGLLKERGLTVHTVTGETYWPHLTLARIKLINPKDIGNYWVQEIISLKPRAFRLSLGLSNLNGVYQKTIFPV